MTTWTAEQASRIGSNEMINIAIELADGSRPKQISIWSVVVDGRVFVRSYGNVPGGWYDTARSSGRGEISSDGVPAVEVHFVQVTDEATNSAIDAEYRRKYAATPYEDDMATEPVRSNTLEAVPV